MYCKKCGKFIGNDADLCDECKAQEETAFGEFSNQKEQPYTPEPTYYSTSTYNGGEVSLGKPIAAIILSHIGFFLIYIGLIVMAGSTYYDDYSAATVLMLIGGSISIVGLVLGIRSIAYFKATSMIKSGKRIPLLILGIISVVVAGIGLFIATLMFMILGML